jgi:hypothetical protein
MIKALAHRTRFFEIFKGMKKSVMQWQSKPISKQFPKIA